MDSQTKFCQVGGVLWKNTEVAGPESIQGDKEEGRVGARGRNNEGQGRKRIY